MPDDALALWLHGLLPLWIAAGFVDWCCRRDGRSDPPGPVQEPTPAVLAIVAHEATTWVEPRFVFGRPAGAAGGQVS